MTTTLLNNRYQVIQVLGAGGFSETFLAEDTHIPSRRRCVIKQLKPIADDPQTYQMIQQRFEREAATLEYLGDSSDQIPQLYAYFSENGQFYLVQEWIHGQTLSNIVAAKGNESEAAVREILLSLLFVLDYVHSKGIIHRDIKPDNIILRAVDQKPVLIDFGAVKETIRSVVSSANYPTRSLVIGTPGYMPSEQAIGRPVYASDIYSLGLTAIYLLTGKHPAELQTNQQTGEIIWQNHAPHVSSHLAMVINQAIKPHAGDRYSTANKMLYALKSASYVAPQPINTAATISLSPVATAQTLPTQIAPAKNRQKSILIVGGLLVGSLIGGVALSNLTRQQQTETSIVKDDTSIVSPQPTDSPVDSQPSSSLVTPSSPPQQPAISTPPTDNNREVDADSNFPDTTTPQPDEEPVTSDNPAPTVTSAPQPEPIDKPSQKKQDNINRQSVPAFSTGTPRSTVEAVLGKPKKDLRGLWGNTRAVTYQLVPNQIDLGYLFDRESGVLRQTEAAFAQTVDSQVMQATLSGILNGQVTPEIQQGLQQIQQRQREDFSFTQGSVKGQIVRQNCDFIYISVWDADLHDFVKPSSAKKCS
ncbi:protein kinase [Nostocaceae cyanobacterium CENA357]|uniref:non-specific serine/threonine protein kinase n=1 Tax=Atlanticothrix silvestris CENA357 TaxID=1725252 RepID=A0A8J7HHB4_9CYAN|nr:serine/threonine-protein kinase [Atlanticothrix silvestris]MBH8553080.1 protein kinase [Atlanticothrix silvestris CENA357]